MLAGPAGLEKTHHPYMITGFGYHRRLEIWFVIDPGTKYHFQAYHVDLASLSVVE